MSSCRISSPEFAGRKERLGVPSASTHREDSSLRGPQYKAPPPDSSTATSTATDSSTATPTATSTATGTVTSITAMPQYNAAGVTATLSMADLGKTLSSKVILSMGAAQAKEQKRIRDSLLAGSVLPERPIGADGSDKSVLQYIGEDEDMPLLMTEVGETVQAVDQRPRPSLKVDAVPRLGAADPSQEVSSLSGSPLTSLDVTPTSATAQNSLPPLSVPTETAHFVSHPDSPLKPLGGTPPARTLQSNTSRPVCRDTVVDGLALEHSPRQSYALPFADSSYCPRALVLTVTTSEKTLLSRANKRSVDTDLKVEVFVNGELVDVHFINTKRVGTDNRCMFAGTRVHRQVEKPWVYRGAEELVDTRRSARERWEAIGFAMQEEVRIRGCDNKNMLPPSAEYLNALSEVPLPQRVQDKPCIGIIDVVIITGKGNKLGPDSGYITKGATRMSSTRFQAGARSGEELTQESEDTLALSEPIANRMLHGHGRLETDIPPTTTEKLLSGPAYMLTAGPQHSAFPTVRQPLRSHAHPATVAWRSNRYPFDPGMQNLPAEQIEISIAQARTEMALDSGALPMGRLVGSMLSHRPVPTRFATSTVAVTPRSSLLKLQGVSRHTSEVIPPHLSKTKKGMLDNHETYAVQPSKAQDVGKGRKIIEQTGDEAVAAFEVPALCQGSVVSYAGAGMQRQIAKARPGDFEEDQVVCGMRFVVS